MSRNWAKSLVIGVFGVFGLAVGCGSPSEVGLDEGDGGNGGSNKNACRELFGEDCGRACDEKNVCPGGMHCARGACAAECGKGFSCENNGVCSSTGICSEDGLSPGGSDPCSETCESLGWACGYTLDGCGNVLDCSKEGLGCKADEACVGGIDAPTQCIPASSLITCEVCGAIPNCSEKPQTTKLSGRVVSPGRNDADTANQVGVPNALVYILQSTDLESLPPIATGLPAGGESCDRCAEQDVGPVLAGAVTDSTGKFELQGNIPVGQEFLLVVKAGKFRRVVKHTLPASAACETTNFPEAVGQNPTRLPRNVEDGLAVNIPRIAISTGAIDAMECVFRKMGIDANQFGAPASTSPIHLYRANGARHPLAAACNDCGTGNGTTARNCRRDNCGGETTTARTNFLAQFDDVNLFNSISRIESYDMVVFDCEGAGYDGNGTQLATHGERVREYVNRGGRLFASHLSYTWLRNNGTQNYSASTPFSTGLNAVASWETGTGTLYSSGTGAISVAPYPQASPRIEGFTEWMVNEGITSQADDYEFDLVEPRSMSTSLGSHSEVFVHRTDENERVQQFSFNTPYGAPEAASCGRVAYSGFHVAAAESGTSPFQNSTFPTHCQGSLGNNGVLTDQEKVLLYMLFDLGACVGVDPPGAPCVKATCESAGVQCGRVPDGCGGLLDCGTCSGPR